MFGIFKKDPLANLQKQYHRKLEEAMQAQRNGDIKSYSILTVEADNILQNIETLEKEKSR